MSAEMQRWEVEVVATFSPEELVADERFPVWVLDYTGTRGTTRRSECRFNDAASAARHGRQMLGLTMRRSA